MSDDRQLAIIKALRDIVVSLTCAGTTWHTDEQVLQHIEFAENKLIEIRGYINGSLVPPKS